MFLIISRSKKCKRAIGKDPYTLKYVLDQYKTQEMCERAMEEDPYTPKFVPIHLITQEICNEAVAKCPWFFERCA